MWDFQDRYDFIKGLHFPHMEDCDRFSDLRKLVREFISDRDWEQFHRPKDISMALSIEAGELMELYLWDRKPKREDLEDEIADIFFFLLDMADREEVDLTKVLLKKLEKNKDKYPADIVRGKDEKYTRYQ